MTQNTASPLSPVHLRAEDAPGLPAPSPELEELYRDVPGDPPRLGGRSGLPLRGHASFDEVEHR
jgi:hypothetical protein